MIKSGYSLNSIIDEAVNEDLFIKVCDALDDAGIRYSVIGRKKDTILVSKSDLEKASAIRNKIDPSYTVTVCSRI